ncbi:MAG: SDR family NAD(P)-dependent oxidoreductase [Erysipelotrichaceae bacterium]|nr:SDR family NAD(P)-dependent oxidoreductase [Erysipelotrichaceae bacterium]
MQNKRILITGSSGFIGASLCCRLLKEGNVSIVGVDNMNDYYDVSLKEARLKQLLDLQKDFTFIKGDISDKEFIDSLFDENRFDIVINLAAQAGVRYSIDHPDVYISSNIIGFYNLMEAVRKHPVSHLIYASSSSIYGNSNSVPFSTEDRTDQPVSLYAATKKTDELMAYTYSHLYHIPLTGLRFFTVYGPAGRPDMAYFSFTEKLLRGEKIRIFNYGNCKRDFTYIDDIVEGIVRIIEKGPMKEYNLYNIGNSHPENLLEFVHVLGDVLIENGLLPADFNIEEHLDLVEMQPGDVEVTYSDTSALQKDYGFHPDTPLKDGLEQFVRWYKEYNTNKKTIHRNPNKLKNLM